MTVKRLHDTGHKANYLIWLLIPVLGVIVVFRLLFKKGMSDNNKFGINPTQRLDYLTVNIDDDGKNVVNDVTQINPIEVFTIVAPNTIDEIIEVLSNTSTPISFGGGHFSMGGTTASINSIHLDLRRLNKILGFYPEEKRITVEAGCRWCDIQKFIDSHNLSVKIMQTYANFTVGGALSVNAHGRYMGLGPVVLSVLSIKLILASGEIVLATHKNNQELFYAAIGGYGALGIIVEVELALADNIRVQQDRVKLPVEAYAEWFDRHLRGEKGALFHNADIYPPHFKKLSAVTWSKTDAAATSPRLQSLRQYFPLEKYFLWAISETPLGKFRREHIIDRLIYIKKRVHYRNYEAGYDAAELEPISRKRKTWVLQEYFIPVEKFDVFAARIAKILQDHAVNVLNISVRHALSDPGTMLAWARGETFAFVLYYKQGTSFAAKESVAVWTREIIDAAINCEGAYYLPYQQHATAEQFHSAYPNATKLFNLKKELDPQYRFRNTLWDKYYQPWLKE